MRKKLKLLLHNLKLEAEDERRREKLNAAEGRYEQAHYYATSAYAHERVVILLQEILKD